MDESIRENIRMIFRTAGMLNYHVTRGKAEKDRILKYLKKINYLSIQVLESIIAENPSKLK